MLLLTGSVQRGSFPPARLTPRLGPGTCSGLFFCSAESETQLLPAVFAKGTILMLRWPFVASALAIIALIIVLLLVSLVQDYKQLRSVQKELGRTKEQAAKLEKVIANLKTELDEANKARTQLQGNLSEVNTKAEQLGKHLSTAQSQLKEKEAQEQELTAELEKARKEAEGQLAAQSEASQKQFQSLTKAAD